MSKIRTKPTNPGTVSLTGAELNSDQRVWSVGRTKEIIARVRTRVMRTAPTTATNRALDHSHAITGSCRCRRILSQVLFARYYSACSETRKRDAFSATGRNGVATRRGAGRSSRMGRCESCGVKFQRPFRFGYEIRTGKYCKSRNDGQSEPQTGKPSG